MSRQAISAPDATAVGPYSHGIRARGDVVFLSGQTPLDSATGKLVVGDIKDQVRQCLGNLGAVLAAANLTFDDVVKCNVFLVDMADFPALNEVYASHFREPFPARTTIGVASLPLGARVEIEMVAIAHGV
ncbi:Rid family detoxifying hydrolase [Bosea sp. 685]|uniref:RidA family protein n=1 Tax=Bosea sp. 685 TaxID=3080057 RepID=UPI002892AF7E|nr:Rid family detoxifying hydrolase [Bosea sp. 685]WNJ87892.1 Rid family detoxifying hydrolase [Bosea sp. 685]